MISCCPTLPQKDPDPAFYSSVSIWISLEHLLPHLAIPSQAARRSMELLYCPATVMMIDQDCQRAPVIADCPPRSLYFAWSAALALPSSPVSSYPSPELPSTLSHTFTEAHAPLLPPQQLNLCPIRAIINFFLLLLVFFFYFSLSLFDLLL